MGGGAGAGGAAGMGGMGGTGGMVPTETSCLDLLNGGANTDGPYTINVGGSPLTVYCDMTTAGGGWTQLYDQDINVPPGYASTAEWSAGINVDSPNMGHYSILHLIDEFEGMSAGFEFYIDWPGAPGDFVQWEQSANPFVGRSTVSNVVESPTNQDGCGAFAGLAADGDSSQVPPFSASTLDGSLTTCFWWAIGMTGPQAGGIPAYFSSDAGQLVASHARLWVR
jgi:hypothetical protein